MKENCKDATGGTVTRSSWMLGRRKPDDFSSDLFPSSGYGGAVAVVFDLRVTRYAWQMTVALVST